MSILTAFALAGVFGMVGIMAIIYYHAVPDQATLRARLPNRITPAGWIAATLVGIASWWIISHSAGIGRVRAIVGLLFDLLIFESAILLAMRWIKNNVVAVVLSLLLATGAFITQRTYPTTIVFNLTFIIAVLGPTTLLIRLEYLRSKFLMLVALLWMIYDVMSNLFIFPKIYKVADRPHTSFLFPALAVGQLTLGSGDLMFLALFTVVIFRDYGRQAALVHVFLQTLALLITVLVKPPQVGIPYLVIMTPIFFAVWWWSKRKQPSSGLSLTSNTPS